MDNHGIPGFHPDYSLLKPDSKVYHVGDDVLYLVHACRSPRPASAARGSITISLIRASHNTVLAGICKYCHAVYIGGE